MRIMSRRVLRRSLVIAVLGIATSALAHDFWLDGSAVDSVTKRVCCGVKDYRIIDPSKVHITARGYHLDDTQENFGRLQTYLQGLQEGSESHPSGKENAWRKCMFAVPVSALNKEGVERIPEIVIGLLGS